MKNTLFSLQYGDAIDAYKSWPSPDCIIVDGPYGVGGFFGDPRTPDSLADWYRPHIEKWSRAAKLSTTLWFWGTEIGWATVHPELSAAGWEYVQTVHWDKGIGQVAGNVNGTTVRRFPTVNEICVFYTRKMEFKVGNDVIPARKWLLDEWIRTGLPRNRANDACGVKNAATRKYFDQGWLWYPPSADVMMKLVGYANEHGDPNGRPYYSLNGTSPIQAADWEGVRYYWHHQHGLTNVLQLPSLRGAERVKGTGIRHAPRVHKPTAGIASAHLNQKPLAFMRRILLASTRPEDVLWEPFGGLCSASVAAIQLKRKPFAAEIDKNFFNLARERLEATSPELIPEDD
jgi:site-specific DNA-methyltransferase (adenine-specific)